MTRKKITLASALLLAGSSFSLAQTSPTTPSPTPPAVAPAPSMPPPALPDRSERIPAGETIFYSHQTSDVRASKLIGTRVVNVANETVGDINEVILHSNGKVAAVIIGVGGFLGIGEREVAVGYQALRVSRDSNNNLVISMDATKDSLKSAPAWTWKQALK